MNTSEGPLYSYDSSVPPLDQGVKWKPNKKDCDSLRGEYPALFKESGANFSNLFDAVAAGTIRTGVEQARNYFDADYYEANTYFYVNSDGSFSYTEPSSWRQGNVNYPPSGARAIGVGHSQNTSISQIVARFPNVSRERAQNHRASGALELFSMADMRTTAIDRLPGPGFRPGFITLHTPTNDLRIYSQGRHGFPANSSDDSTTHPGDRLNNIPSKEVTGKIIDCIKGGY